jgi:hypothetical protein
MYLDGLRGDCRKQGLVVCREAVGIRRPDHEIQGRLPPHIQKLI